MQLLKSASDALQRHKANVALYAATNIALALIASLFMVLLRMQNPDVATDPTSAQRVIDVVLLLGLTVAVAFVQVVVFSRIGRELDRPLWKVADDREAIRRFFTLWFEFNLIVYALFWLANTLAKDDTLKEASALPLLTGLVGAIILVPFAAALMFHGNFSWGRLGEGLAPLGRRLPQLAPVFLLTLAQILIFIFLDTAPPESIDAQLPVWIACKVAIHGATAYLDCLVFTATWMICKDDRDSPDELDLDF